MEGQSRHNEDLEIKAVRPFRSRLWIRLSLLFLLGFIAGVIVTGTMKCSRKDAPGPGSGKKDAENPVSREDALGRPETVRYETPLVKAVYTVRYSPETIEIQVEFSSLYPMKSLVEFDVNNMVIQEIGHLEVNDQSTDMSASGFIQFNCVGNNKYLIRLSNENDLPHKIDFSLLQNDIALYRHSVRINKH
jgi:hypothetical protein